MCLLAAALAALVAAAPARAGKLRRDRQQARSLAAQVTALDARIGVAVQRYATATAALETVQARLRDVRRQRRVARLELSIARMDLARRAVALYKRGDVTSMDVLFSANSFQQLVDQVTMVRRVDQTDQDVVRAVLTSQQELEAQTAALTADQGTALRLVVRRSADLAGIRSELGERQRLLTGVKADIARLVARQVKASPPQATVEPPSGGGGVAGGGGAAGGGGGQGAWWPLIRTAAAAQGVDARGMYRLMMIESGGSATAVGPGGYYGLFQYAPATWKGSWNPYRGASIYDGAAQIRATALAIHLGHGRSWWDPSFCWAFGA